jgi:glutathione S-transferase
MPEMKLYWSSRSPFARKVMVAAHELGLAGRIECVPTATSASDPNPDLLVQNPLGRLPAMRLADGSALYDSTVICEYLDTLAGPPRLFPEGPARLTALRRQSLGDGMLDTLVLWRNELLRKPEFQSAPHLSAYRIKTRNSLAAVENEIEAIAREPVNIAHVVLGVMLAYLDFRFADEAWREGRPRLAAWYADFSRRPSMTATQARETAQ